MQLNDFIVNNEIQIRLGFFFGVFIVMAFWEWAAPRRQLTSSQVITLDK